MAISLVEKPRARVVLFFTKLLDNQYPMWAPIELYAIETALLNAGFEVTLIDQRVDANYRDWLRHEIPGALFFGIAAKLGDQVRNMLEIAEYVKGIRQDCPVVMGGWFPSLFPEQSLEAECVDVAIQGPGDFNTPILAERLLQGESLEGIPGVWAKQNGTRVHTAFEHLPPMERTHPIPWELLGIKRYLHPHDWLNYFSSRGCPGACTFCAISCLDARHWTALPAERVVDELEQLSTRCGARQIRFMDTDFCADIKRVEQISRLLIERKIQVHLAICARHYNLSRMTEEQVRMFREAGCIEIEFGIETGSQRLMDLLNKPIQVDQIVATAERFIRAGIRLKVNFMFGIPSEERDDLRATLGLVRRLKKLGDGLRFQIFRYGALPDAALSKKIWNTTRPSRDPNTPPTFQELLELPINTDPTEMPWISEPHERAINRVLDFYMPLAYYRNALENVQDRPVWRTVMRLFRKLARLRNAACFHALPFEFWLNERFGRPCPRAEDNGVTTFCDVLPPEPLMGDSVSRLPPLAAAGAGQDECGCQH